MSNNVTSEQTAQAWYVMRHLNPAWIESMLQKDCSGRLLRQGEQPLPPYRFFIPYQNMPRVITGRTHADRLADDRRYDPVGDVDRLRGDLRSYVFIQAPQSRVEALVKSDWNRSSSVRLYFFRDTDGSMVTLPDADMHRLIKTLQDRQLRFYLDQPIDDFAVGDRVVLQMEPWTGKTAEVRKIVFKHDRVKLTVSLNIFGRTKSITFPDVAVGDVLFVDKARGRMLSGNPIANYEEEIIDLLSHRYSQKHPEDYAELDNERLKRLAAYSNIYVEDAEERTRYVALKLICAHLRSDSSRRERYQAEVSAMLGIPHGADAIPQPASFLEAYLMMALFITTRNPRYRDAVKAYRTTHPDCPDILRRYHTIVKDLKSKKY